MAEGEEEEGVGLALSECAKWEESVGVALVLRVVTLVGEAEEGVMVEVGHSGVEEEEGKVLDGVTVTGLLTLESIRNEKLANVGSETWAYETKSVTKFSVVLFLVSTYWTCVKLSRIMHLVSGDILILQLMYFPCIAILTFLLVQHHAAVATATIRLRDSLRQVHLKTHHVHLAASFQPVIVSISMYSIIYACMLIHV